jgi:hypothetical protein
MPCALAFAKKANDCFYCVLIRLSWDSQTSDKNYSETGHMTPDRGRRDRHAQYGWPQAGQDDDRRRQHALRMPNANLVRAGQQIKP